MARSRKKLGDILVGWGVLSSAQLEKAMNTARSEGKRLGDAIIDAGFAKEDQVAKALANQFGMEYVDLSADGIAEKIDTKLVPEELIKTHLILPIGRTTGPSRSPCRTRWIWNGRTCSGSASTWSWTPSCRRAPPSAASSIRSSAGRRWSPKASRW